MNQQQHSMEEDFMLSWSPELRRALRSRPLDDEMLPSDYVKRTKPSTYDTPGRSLETRLFISNEFVHSVSGRIYTSVSLGNVQESTCEDVDKAVSFRYTFKEASICVHYHIFGYPSSCSMLSLQQGPCRQKCYGVSISVA